MQPQQQDGAAQEQRGGACGDSRYLKLYFIVTAFRFNPTHMQAWQGGLVLVSPRPG